MADIKTGGTLIFSEKYRVAEPLTISKDVVFSAPKGIFFSQGLKVDDAFFSVSNAQIDGKFVVSGTKPLTISAGAVTKTSYWDIDTSGDVTITQCNFFNAKSSAGSALKFGKNCGKVTLDRNTFHGPYPSGAIQAYTGLQLVTSHNSFMTQTVNANIVNVMGSKNSGSFLFSGDDFGYQETEAAAGTAFIGLHKVDETGTTEFDSIRVSANRVRHGQTYLTKDMPGLDRFVLVFSNKGNIITTDAPQVAYQ